MTLERSPLAPAHFPTLPDIGGLRLAVHETGLKYQGRPDLLLTSLAPGTAIAGVLTRSSTCSAAVLDCRAKLGQTSDAGAAIIVNAGNANAFTGRLGAESVEVITSAAADALEIPVARVFSASTGVIGEPLASDRITGVLGQLVQGLGSAGFEQAAQAICTTDTFPKGAGRQVQIGGQTVSIAGIAKGSGMIAPDMATMLSYVFTDAKIDQAALQQMLARLTDRTFNSITVDSDTSTSDTLLVAATGASGVDVADDLPAFEDALHAVMLDLAQQVVRDGEGASKFIEVRVTSAKDNADARKVALSIANSPLVKTAIAGQDANWGRVVMAVGKSGAQADRDRLSIQFGDLLVAQNGWMAEGYSDADGQAYMTRDEIQLSVDLGLGSGTATVWTCDLTHGYIQINADYRS